MAKRGAPFGNKNAAGKRNGYMLPTGGPSGRGTAGMFGVGGPIMSGWHGYSRGRQGLPHRAGSAAVGGAASVMLHGLRNAGGMDVSDYLKVAGAVGGVVAGLNYGAHRIGHKMGTRAYNQAQTRYVKAKSRKR